MKKLATTLAALAAIGFSGAALAEEVTTGSWVTTTGPAAMTEAEMDGVTAAGQPSPLGEGLTTAGDASAGRAQGLPPSTAGQSTVSPGYGKATAPGQQ